eukprot:4979311-Alexandrium_andersonii.AAC.1
MCIRDSSGEMPTLSTLETVLASALRPHVPAFPSRSLVRCRGLRGTPLEEPLKFPDTIRHVDRI